MMGTAADVLVRLDHAEELLREAIRDVDMFPAMQREKMPLERASVTRRLSIPGPVRHPRAKGNSHPAGDGITCYATVGLYPDGRPGELFLVGDKTGSLVGGLLDVLSIAVSVGLQWGVPFRDLVQKFRHTRFEPSGFTGDDRIHSATSIVDMLAQWLEGLGDGRGDQ